MPKQLIFSDDARKNTHPFSAVRMLLFVCAIAAIAFADMQTARAQQNPITGTMTVFFKRNGTIDSEEVTISGLWESSLNPWNGKFTTNGSVRISNVVTSQVFPCGTQNITAAEVNAYWDEQYPGATRIAEPTWSCNCHGHSTGLGYWVQDYDTVLQYDWLACTSMDDVASGCSHIDSTQADHSIKVTGVASVLENAYRVVSETTEKMAYAGTYRSIYFLPGGAALIGVSGTYKKKQEPQ